MYNSGNFIGILIFVGGASFLPENLSLNCQVMPPMKINLLEYIIYMKFLELRYGKSQLTSTESGLLAALAQPMIIDVYLYFLLDLQQRTLNLGLVKSNLSAAQAIIQ